MHSRAEGQEGFSLQVFLQLARAADPAAVFPGPRMIWELGTSSAQSGSKPRIPLSSWEVLPQQASEGWSGTVDGHCTVVTREGRYRHRALDHAP